MKVAFTGTSGSGKTTLCKWVAQEFGLKHISSSAQDLFTAKDKDMLNGLFGYTGLGHANVIRMSANDYSFGHAFQTVLLARRMELIDDNHNFVTDRSPVDNMTYFVNQVGMHKEFTNAVGLEFFRACIGAYSKLTHLVYVRATQPELEVEDNGSRVANGIYQTAIDAQFRAWLDRFIAVKKIELLSRGPKVLVIDYWDLKKRKEELYQFLKRKYEEA